MAGDQIWWVGESGYRSLAGFGLQLDDAETSMELVKSQGFVEKFRGG